MQAFQCQRFKALTDDEFGTAATDIDDQTLAGIIGQRVRHAEVDQTRFFASGDDFDGVAQYFFSTADELFTVARSTQSVGGQHRDAAAIHALQALAEFAQAVDTALLSFFRQDTCGIKAGAKLYLLATFLDGADFALKFLGNNHMEAVRTQIYGSDEIVRGSLGVRHI